MSFLADHLYRNVIFLLPDRKKMPNAEHSCP